LPGRPDDGSHAGLTRAIVDWNQAVTVAMALGLDVRAE
jgi:hypothetical protein